MANRYSLEGVDALIERKQIACILCNASETGILQKLKSSASTDFATSGHRLPDKVYRGAAAANEQTSGMSDDRGVYVTTDPSTASQWGDVKEYAMRKQALLLDLDNFNSRARDFVAHVLGVARKRLTEEQFNDAAPEIFVQNDGKDWVKQMGFGGYRLGHDAFLFGKLSDYADESEPPSGA